MFTPSSRLEKSFFLMSLARVVFCAAGSHGNNTTFFAHAFLDRENRKKKR